MRPIEVYFPSDLCKMTEWDCDFLRKVSSIIISGHCLELDTKFITEWKYKRPIIDKFGQAAFYTVYLGPGIKDKNVFDIYTGRFSDDEGSDNRFEADTANSAIKLLNRFLLNQSPQ